MNGQHFLLLLALAACAFVVSDALDNGLALTPPMGWLSWERFRCNTDCDNDPENCLSENLMKQQAEEMVKQGFLDAGYEYIIVDDCWLDHERGTDGKLKADPKRFPSGMKALGDYIHGLGLKYGIYEDYGTHTCGGYPGILDHLELDAQTLADFGADYVKIDGCYVNTTQMDTGYPELGRLLNKTGRPIVYSCSWPAYQKTPDYPSIAKHCNLWRNYGDIQDSWDSVVNIINWFATNQDTFADLAGPGNWNDPDMVIGGNFGLSLDQAKVQMAVWSIMASPLIMSNDLRNIHPDFKNLLLNKNVIKINQDPLGIQGKRVKNANNIQTWVRPVMPTVGQNKSAAVAVVNMGNGGSGDLVTFTPASLGLTHTKGYTVTEVFANTKIQDAMPSDSIRVKVNPSGVQLLRLDVKGSDLFANNKKNMGDISQVLGDFKVINLGDSGILEQSDDGKIVRDTDEKKLDVEIHIIN